MFIHYSKKLSLLIFSICLLFFVVNPVKAEAEEELIISQEEITNKTATLPQWQTITIPVGVENISKIWLNLGSAGSTATLGFSTTYNGAILDSVNTEVDTGSYYSLDWHLFDFSADPFSVNEGEIWYLRLSYTGAMMKYQFSVNDPYAGGRLQLGGNNDFAMRIYTQTIPDPPPPPDPPEEPPVEGNQSAIEVSTLVVETIRDNTVGIITGNILQIITLGLLVICIMLTVKILKKFD